MPIANRASGSRSGDRRVSRACVRTFYSAFILARMTEQAECYAPFRSGDERNADRMWRSDDRRSDDAFTPSPMSGLRATFFAGTVAAARCGARRDIRTLKAIDDRPETPGPEGRAFPFAITHRKIEIASADTARRAT